MLNDNVLNKLEIFSSLIRKEFKLKLPIMNLNHLINDLGGKVEQGKENLEKTENSFRIKILQDPYSPSGKFNILKSLGILIFENGLLIDEEKWKSLKEIIYPDNYELANEFAASMLMPRDIFIDYFTDNYDLEDTANQFGVSETLVRVRASRLGLILF